MRLSLGKQDLLRNQSMNKKMQNLTRNKDNFVELPSTLKLAIYFLMSYGMCIALNVVYYIYSSNSDYSKIEVFGGLMNVLGVIGVCYALYKKYKWGFWVITIILGMRITVLLVAIIPLLMSLAQLDAQSIHDLFPFTLPQQILITLSMLSAISSFIFLIHPKTRAVFNRSPL